MMERPVVRVGVIGGGFVGAALVQLLSDPARHVALVDAATAPLELVGVAVRDASKPRAGIDPALLTTDVEGLIASDLDVVGINEYIGWYSHLPADADAAEMEIRLRQAADYERIRR